jgi:hypothetical protein
MSYEGGCHDKKVLYPVRMTIIGPKPVGTLKWSGAHWNREASTERRFLPDKNAITVSKRMVLGLWLLVVIAPRDSGLVHWMNDALTKGCFPREKDINEADDLDSGCVWTIDFLKRTIFRSTGYVPLLYRGIEAFLYKY